MPIRGFIEQLSNRQVRGWAYRPDYPDEHLLIEVSSNSEIIATARASLFRDDLKQANVGNGDHAFVVNFPELLDDARLVSVKVRCFSSDAGTVYLNFVKAPEKTDPPADKPPPQVILPEKPLAQQQPVFILGAARSGTSAMAQGLLKTSFYEGYEEGHIFDLAARLISAVHAHYENNGEEITRNTLIAQVPMRLMNEGIKDQFRTIARFCFRGYRWLDKTPRREMVLCAPLLREIWPEARFVFMKRRAIENIASRLRKFPEIPFADHCREWSETMRAWREVREALGEWAIEIEQLDMALDPASVVKRLAVFLDLPRQASARLTELLSAEQPERTADRFGGVLDLDELDWLVDEKATFERICMAEMRAFGYGVDTAYYLGKRA